MCNLDYMADNVSEAKYNQMLTDLARVDPQ